MKQLITIPHRLPLQRLPLQDQQQICRILRTIEKMLKEERQGERK